jgi:asparagine synthase (glutamine-hydrolysing)
LGFTGFISFQNTLNPLVHEPTLRSMLEYGVLEPAIWFESTGRIGVSGSRIVKSAGGRSVLLMEGRLFNSAEIIVELESDGCVSQNQADNEVLINALDRWGLERTLEKLNGFFTFAWYDCKDRSLTLARDHAGCKPLYYAPDPSGRGLSFSTRFDSLLCGPWQLPMEINQQALLHYLRLSHFHAPNTLIKNTWQLQAGSFVRVDADNKLEMRHWHQVPRQVENEFLTDDEAVERLGLALEASVERQSKANEPLGVFLSGGIDSPLISAIASRQAGGSLKAFSISVPGWRQDESEDARQYARNLGLDHHVIEISGADAAGVIDEVIRAQYEPFGDFSIIPGIILFRHVQAEVGVVLGGDGGDELFFGYERPFSLMRNGKDFRFPRFVRAGLFGLGKFGIIQRKSEVILSRTPGEYYYGVNSRMNQAWLKRMAPELSRLECTPLLYHFGPYDDELDLANYSRYVEYYGQLQRGLKKVEMAASSQSLDVRAPLLDRQVVDLSLRMDPMETMRSGQRKKALCRLLEKYVPAEIIPTSKRGFGIPLGEWMRGPLRGRVKETLLEGELFPSGVFVKDEVNNYWQEHLSGKADHKWGLWNLLSLQWWARSRLG